MHQYDKCKHDKAGKPNKIAGKPNKIIEPVCQVI